MTPTDSGSPPDRRGRRQDAEANRERIVRAAHALLPSHPDASMDDLARAAGVVRRTLYAHFPNRQALILALAEQAGEDLRASLRGVDRLALPPAVAMADFALALWGVGDNYRLLISLAQRDLGSAGLRDLLAPITTQAEDILARAREEGRFATHLPLPVLEAALTGMTLALLTAVNDKLWAGDRLQAARAVLMACGLSEVDAAAALREALRSRDAQAKTSET